jgi:GNAT superfamily N-acetyltransferase
VRWRARSSSARRSASAGTPAVVSQDSTRFAGPGALATPFGVASGARPSTSLGRRGPAPFDGAGRVGVHREERIMAVIERFEGPVARAEALTEGIQREYLLWCAERLAADYGVEFDDPDAAVAVHEREFTEELPRLLGPRGRLLVARAGSEVVGIGALKPVDATVGEIKRMYVRPHARGQGIGRAILERLLDDARAIGYGVARLETVMFMREAHALYRSRGFRDTLIVDNTEAGLSGLEPFMLFMELPLDEGARP